MTKDEWIVACAEALESEGIENFHPLEIADVGRKAHNTILEAPELTLLPNALMLCKLLCELRESEPVSAVLVNSWYRDPLYNYKIGGATSSMHMTCGAADVTKVGWSTEGVAEWFESHENSHNFGVGRYSTLPTSTFAAE